MEINTNYQTNKKLRHFQKIIVQDLCIKQLNKWLGELEWEIEKKDTIISNKDQEIEQLTNTLNTYKLEIKQLQQELESFSDRYRRATSSGKKLLVKSGVFPR